MCDRSQQKGIASKKSKSTMLIEFQSLSECLEKDWLARFLSPISVQTSQFHRRVFDFGQGSARISNPHDLICSHQPTILPRRCRFLNHRRFPLIHFPPRASLSPAIQEAVPTFKPTATRQGPALAAATAQMSVATRKCKTSWP